MKILVLFAHPALQHSRTNNLLFEAAHHIEGVTPVDLYAEYPRFDIDVDAEQRRLLDHDAIVFQFPLLWYSTPPILKQWQDLVLEHGFAYGGDRGALRGKPWLCAITVGAPESSYSPQGRHRFSLRHLLSPLEATANLCQMPFLAPYVLFGALGVDEAARQSHVAGYKRLLGALRDDRLDIKVASGPGFVSAAAFPEIQPAET